MLRFRKDGTFRVLQLADVQDGPDVSPNAIALIDAAIEAADPDLVVLTGDQVRGYDPAYLDTFVARRGAEPGADAGLGAKAERLLERVQSLKEKISGAASHSGGSGEAGAAGAGESCLESAQYIRNGDALEATRAKLRQSFAGFLEPIVRRGIPFAVTYGNHDFQCGVDVDEQDELYRSFPGCLNPSAPRPYDPDAPASGERYAAAQPETGALACEAGTFFLPVAASDGDGNAMGIALVNSGDFDPAGGYGAPSARAVDWLHRAKRGMTAAGAPLPTIAFQHIPPQEIYDCLSVASRFTPYAIRGYRAFSDRCFVVNRLVCRPGSELNESPCCSERNVGEVDALRRSPGYFALFSGHDHTNTLIGHVGGLDLGYAPTCGFASYGPKKADRALRLLVFRESDPASYDTRLIRYGDFPRLMAMPVTKPARLAVGETMLSSVANLGNQLRRPGVVRRVAVGVALAGIAAAATAVARMATSAR